MLTAIISDIHGNRAALDAVLEEIERLGCLRIVCLGDIVGYGADPGYCVDRVRSACDIVVAGNHDYAVLGRISIEYFNAHAREATLWTREQLTKEQSRFLDGLELVEIDEPSTFVHGSLDSPEFFDYIQTSYDAFLTMEKLTTRVCWIGHSHVPITFLLDEVITFTLDTTIDIASSEKLIINVGSVGQPRDNNPHASFATFDDDALKASIHRIPYNVESTAQRIREAGLPEFLAERIKVGR